MAKVQYKKCLEFTLILSEEEARYLKDLLSNYLGEENSTEPNKHKNIREDLWYALNNTGELKNI